MIPTTIVTMIPEEPQPPKKRYSEFERVAYNDGWKAAASNSPRHVRPNYQTHEEREAFNDGWDVRTSLVLVDDIL
jgi:hypothetical protein